MAGRGPAPKPPERRVGKSKDPHGLRVIHAEPEPQPRLPTGVKWTPQTRKWWKMWADSPLATSFTANDWSELLDTALIHNQLWLGDLKQAAELRLRVAKFGATPEDRARLRITFANADEADEKRGKTAPQRQRRVLTALPAG